ncbi:hypothetical protein SAMN05444159_1152 [Bradyrhizobium lablabi]|uniref:DUF2846 domain-containing protein n=1 Tax=Bradyrhizobium lablabi TaxID=722472 RepID=A0A1M6L2U9_9BRAD|nr:hypothetical protein [Bradyrhizobium lablabi]SHJ65472.1 hypothetical protein SAMN05444159_1152 [Bradyrhizobium lablabi]
MTRTIHVILLLLSTLLAGCVTDQSMPSAVAIGPGQAAIAITRPSAWYGAALAVDIDANGSKIASLESGGSYTGPLPPGPVVLTVTSWSSPGRYVIRFNAQAGKRYAFVVSPRNEQMAATAIGGVIGLAADTAANGETSGAFQITAVPSS